MGYSWAIFALLSAIAASFVAIFGKLGLKGIDSNVATAVRAVIMALFLIGIVALEGKFSKIAEVVGNSKAMYYIVLSGVAGAVSWLFYFLALKIGDASKVAPIDRLSVVFVLIFAFLILGEGISIKVAIGAALVVIGAIIIALG